MTPPCRRTTRRSARAEGLETQAVGDSDNQRAVYCRNEAERVLPRASRYEVAESDQGHAGDVQVADAGTVDRHGWRPVRCRHPEACDGDGMHRAYNRSLRVSSVTARGGGSAVPGCAAAFRDPGNGLTRIRSLSREAG